MVFGWTAPTWCLTKSSLDIYEGSWDDWLCQNKKRQPTLNPSIISSFHLLKMSLKLHPLDVIKLHDWSSSFAQHNTMLHERLRGSTTRPGAIWCLYVLPMSAWVLSANIPGTNTFDSLEALNWPRVWVQIALSPVWPCRKVVTCPGCKLSSPTWDWLRHPFDSSVQENQQQKTNASYWII